ncbi:MAG: TonB-dependent receptor [Candidatus Tectomicrobia bacterium]|uniref:TonB-dependent receptor n=1 Tax=Tectimicrobiota bacterium TaxID=2528274 RepID=A0A932GRG1_UNCTE|nr:TonB-dependent receptor [Candidatus Tectomicrobia bacterium]
MKRLLRIAALSLLVGVANPGFSAQRDPAGEGVEEVVVSATRLPDAGFDVQRLPAHVTILTEKEIKASGAKTLQEVLQNQPGIVVFDQVGNSFQPTVDLRGFNAQPVPSISVFVDGVRVNQPDFNQTNFDLVPLEDVERIEILPGAAAPFGKNALSGVINIITKRGGAKPQITLETLQGGFDRERYRLQAGGPFQKWDYFFGVARDSERGFREESGGKVRRFQGKVGFRPQSQTDLSLSFTHVNDRLSQAGSLPESVLSIDRTRNFTPGDFQDNRLNTVVLNGRRKLPLDLSLSVNAYFRHLATESVVFGQTSTTRDETNIESRGGTLQLTQDTRWGGRRNVLTLGAEYNHHDIGNLGSSITGFPFLNRRATRQNANGFYLQDSFDVSSKVTITGAFRYDLDRLNFTDRITAANSGDKKFRRLSPRAGVVYNPVPALGFYYTYSEGFRTPTQDELFALGAFTSNPDLKPVKSKNHEVGIRTRLAGWGEGTLAFFQSDVRDEIFFVFTDPVEFTGLNQNIDKSRRRGIEVSLKVHPVEQMDGFLNYTFTEATFETDVTVSGPAPTFSQTVRKGDFFPLVPRHRLGGGVNYRPAAGWNVGLTGSYVGSQYLLNDEANHHDRLNPYWVFNSKLAYERKVPGGTMTASLAVENLLNKKYETSGIIATNNRTGQVEPFLVPASGVAAFAGVSYRFEGL